MNIIRSRENKNNMRPVKQPDSSSGFLCSLALKLRHILERAGRFFYSKPKEKPITKPLYQYWINKQVITLFIISLLTTPCFAEPIKLTASWYSIESLKKEGTYKYSKGVQANGKLFDENALTCASCDFPLKTKLRVTAVNDPKKSVIVEVTDRTNKRFKGKRLDLSKGAFSKIANLKQGLIPIKVELIK